MEKQIEELVSDRQKFNNFLYTKLDDAIKELEKRRKIELLEKKLEVFLDHEIPGVFLKVPRATILRNITTPNYELRRFISITDAVGGIKPLIAEYPEDKFVPSNPLKRLLGKIGFFKGMSGYKLNTLLFERIEIIDFDAAEGKKISEINTLWGQSLVEFHHEFFEKTFRTMHNDLFCDISSWYHSQGPVASKYYISILALFVRNGILFENFVLEDKEELDFLKHIVLPAFLKIHSLIGLKPLIVALEPTNIEGSKFWLSYPIKDKKFVEEKLTGVIK